MKIPEEMKRYAYDELMAEIELEQAVRIPHFRTSHAKRQRRIYDLTNNLQGHSTDFKVWMANLYLAVELDGDAIRAKWAVRQASQISAAIQPALSSHSTGVRL